MSLKKCTVNLRGHVEPIQMLLGHNRFRLSTTVGKPFSTAPHIHQNGQCTIMRLYQINISKPIRSHLQVYSETPHQRKLEWPTAMPLKQISSWNWSINITMQGLLNQTAGNLGLPWSMDVSNLVVYLLFRGS